MNVMAVSLRKTVPLGNANPSYSYGLNLGLTYKNWDFSAFSIGVQGNSIWNQVNGGLISRHHRLSEK
ncbi:hypothetical protein CS542_04565 [Pedobacter sp. IW39]|nr:hypothetical protein CS542_04565 [Pedobacter sp. IW39]